jgi:hypothetical protein
MGEFRVKNHDYTPKNHIFSNCGGSRKIVGVFRVKNHDFTPKNLIFSNFRGAPPPLDPPLKGGKKGKKHFLHDFAYYIIPINKKRKERETSFLFCLYDSAINIYVFMLGN